MTGDLLDRVLGPTPPPFALLHRPESAGDGRLDLLLGDVATLNSLTELPVPTDGTPGQHALLVVLPYRQLAERGFAAVDDGSPLLAMTVREQARPSVADVLRSVPADPITMTDADFDVDDATYADTVRRIIRDEIGRGQGSNFVLRRSFCARLGDYSPRRALALFRRLLQQESGVYWTFLVHTGDRTFVGASPERHLSLDRGQLVMNPISGTYRYPSTGPTLHGVLDFLADRKEADELSMVVDEELKMMGRVCEAGGRVVGPFLKEMGKVAHTEYLIEGRTTRDVRELLHQTMFAPTVVGSPLESACRVVARHEPEGRGYYAGVVALVGRDDAGGRALDSAILIRTAEIDRSGRMRIGVGATVVKDSRPEAEVAETHAKAAGMLAALGAGTPVSFADHPDVRHALSRRNGTMAGFWLDPDGPRRAPAPVLAERRVLVVDAEDTFTAMLAHQLRALGLEVSVRGFDEPHPLEAHDLVVMGPGPGDPRETHDPKVRQLRATIGRLLAERRPFLAICLSHQVLAGLVGLPLERRTVPNQGVQKQIDLFGRTVRVGFYNTFNARSDADEIWCDTLAETVEVSRDVVTGDVHALRGDGFWSVQFHPESILSEDGVLVLDTVLTDLLRPGHRRPPLQRHAHQPLVDTHPLQRK